MKKIQQFVEKKKMDHKFKQAGTGHKLDEQRKMPSSKSTRADPVRVAPAASAQRAGEAALARLQPERPASSQSSASIRAIKAQALAEREAELLASECKNLSMSSQASGRSTSPSRPTFQDDQSPVSTGGVFFQCPFGCPDIFPRSEVDEHLKMCILTRLLPENPLDALAKMIHTNNKDKQKRQAGIEVICKYLDNVCNHPTEEKYHKIRIGNKAFQERVACLEGTEEFLQAVGFIPEMLPIQDEEEPFLVLTPEAASKTAQLQLACEQLLTTEPIRATLYRNVKIYRPSTQAGLFQLPQEFYRVTSEDVKREHQLRTEAVERNAQLRTKTMKEAETQKNLRRYRYTLIRVRLPDGIILQGTFYANDKLSTVLKFIRGMLINDWQPFVLTDATGKKLIEEDCSMAELKLAPAAVVNFSWDAAIMAEITAAQGSTQRGDCLKPEVMSTIQTL